MGSSVSEADFKDEGAKKGGCCSGKVIGGTVLVTVFVAIMAAVIATHKPKPAPIVERQCFDTCKTTLVETLPGSLRYSKDAPKGEKLGNEWMALLANAKKTVKIMSPSMKLTTKDTKGMHAAASEGVEDGSKLLAEIKKLADTKKISIKILLGEEELSDSAKQLAESYAEVKTEKGGAALEIRQLSTKALTSEGKMTANGWIIDDEHLYIGSAGLDWRALRDYKQTGIVATQCGCLAMDMGVAFDVAWDTAKVAGVPEVTIGKDGTRQKVKVDKTKIRSAMTDVLEDREVPFNAEAPHKVYFYRDLSDLANVYFAATPAAMRPDGREAEVSAVLRLVDEAQEYLYLSAPSLTSAFVEHSEGKNTYWPNLTNGLLRAAIDRNVRVRVLVANEKYDAQGNSKGPSSPFEFLSTGAANIEIRYFGIPETESKSGRDWQVNDSSFVVSEKAAYMTASADGWSADTFVSNAGLGLMVNQTTTIPASAAADVKKSSGAILNNKLMKFATMKDQLRRIFDRDWFSEYSNTKHTEPSVIKRTPAEKCADSCKLTIAESLPESLGYRMDGSKSPNGQFMTEAQYMATRTHTKWMDILSNAKVSIKNTASYWSMRPKETIPAAGEKNDKGTKEGDELVAMMMKKIKEGVKVQIVQKEEPVKNGPSTADYFMDNGAEVRGAVYWRLSGHGILHSKLWVVDSKHFYIGSNNMDWKSVAQVKELGVVGEDCACLAKDLERIWNNIWKTGGLERGQRLPGSIDFSAETERFNAHTPHEVSFSLANDWSHPTAKQTALIHFANAPEWSNPPGRDSDLDATLRMLNEANEFYYSASKYFVPAWKYPTPTKDVHWPKVKSALINAAARGVQVRLLVSAWMRTKQVSRYAIDEFQMTKKFMTELFKGRKGVEKDFAKNLQIRWFVVPQDHRTPSGTEAPTTTTTTASTEAPTTTTTTASTESTASTAPAASSRLLSIPKANIGVDGNWWVNHNKYSVNEKTAMISTSNWSADYFLASGGSMFVVHQEQKAADGEQVLFREQMKKIFERDWESGFTSEHFPLCHRPKWLSVDGNNVDKVVPDLQAIHYDGVKFARTEEEKTEVFPSKYELHCGEGRKPVVETYSVAWSSRESVITKDRKPIAVCHAGGDLMVTYRNADEDGPGLVTRAADYSNFRCQR